MNIFHLSNCPVESAQCLHDRHVVKMTLETAQLLSQAVRLAPEWRPYVKRDNLYGITHQHHPSARWCRLTVPNLYWLAKHGMALADEYSHRFWRTHKSRAIIKYVLDIIPKLPERESDDLTRFAQAMPLEYRNDDDPVLGYRNYYVATKIHPDSAWTARRADLPDWLFKPALFTGV